MRKSRVYVETSVWNFLLAEDVPSMRKAALLLLGRNEKYDFCISPMVITEINRAPLDIKSALTKAIKKAEPDMLEINEEIERLAAAYITAAIIPSKYEGDAYHIATASYYDVEYLVSYNFRHIVKVRTKAEVVSVNIKWGFRTPTIITPEELVEYEE